MKTLLVMRHAKSDWDTSYGGDHERPLSRRGVEAARQMGRHLTAIDLVPDLVVSSTAVRARTTAELAAEAGQWQSDLHLDGGFYGASVDDVLEIVSRTSDSGRLMIVGHQPTWGSLVAHLTGEPIEVRTATVAVVALPVDSWTEVVEAQGSLVAVHHPRRSE